MQPIQRSDWARWPRKFFHAGMSIKISHVFCRREAIGCCVIFVLLGTDTCKNYARDRNSRIFQPRYRGHDHAPERFFPVHDMKAYVGNMPRIGLPAVQSERGVSSKRSRRMSSAQPSGSLSSREPTGAHFRPRRRQGKPRRLLFSSMGSISAIAALLSLSTAFNECAFSSSSARLGSMQRTR